MYTFQENHSKMIGIQRRRPSFPELATPSSPLELCTRNGMCSVVAIQQDERIVLMVAFCKSTMVDGGVQR